MIVKSIVESIKREQFRKKNRETQFSGSAVKEEKGFWASLFTPKYGSRAKAIGDHGDKRVSSFWEDLDCEEYRVYNDLLIRNGNYTTQVDHIVISRYGVFVLETKNVHGKVYGGGNAEYWKQYLPDTGYKRYGTTQEHQLRNPIWQNDGHIKTLRRLVFDKDVPVFGIVVFPSDTDINVTADQPVLNMYNVVPYIKQYRNKVLSSDQMDFYRRRLLPDFITFGLIFPESASEVLVLQIDWVIWVTQGVFCIFTPCSPSENITVPEVSAWSSSTKAMAGSRRYTA